LASSTYSAIRRQAAAAASTSSWSSWWLRPTAKTCAVTLTESSLAPAVEHSTPTASIASTSSNESIIFTSGVPYCMMVVCVCGVCVRWGEEL
jgi:hypothetical protein